MLRTLILLLLAGATGSSATSAQEANFELLLPDVRAFAEVVPRLPMALVAKEPDFAAMLSDFMEVQQPSELIEAALGPYLPNVPLAEMRRDALSIHARGYATSGVGGWAEDWMIVRLETASEPVATAWADKLLADAVTSAATNAGTETDAPADVRWLRPGLWLDREGATLVLGYGAAPDQATTGDPVGIALLEPLPGSVPVLELRGRAGYLLDRFFAETEAPAALGGWFAGLGDSDMHALMEAFGAKDGQPGRLVTRMRRDPRSTTTQSDLESALGVQTLDPAWLENLPAGSMFASASSIDAKRAVPALLASSGFEGLDWERLEADLGFPLDRLWSRMGPEFTLWADPIGGPAIPPTFVRIGVRERDAFQADWDAFVDAVAAQLDGVEISRRDYKVKDAATGDRVPVPITSIRADGLSLQLDMFDLSVNPAMCVLDQTLLIASSSAKLKQELKRHYGDETVATLDLSRRLKAQGLSNATTAWQFDYVALLGGVLDLAKLAGGMGASDMLPIDLAKLPSIASMAKHVQPTFHAQGVDDKGAWVVHEASFGPETWAALYGAFEIFTARIEDALGSSFGGPIEGSIPVPAAVPGPADLTRDAITDIRVGIAVFEMMNERLPTSLEELVKPTDVFPEGFLEAPVVPNDGWGRAFRFAPESTGAYRLWSLGPDGTDQEGAGDDVVAGS